MHRTIVIIEPDTAPSPWGLKRISSFFRSSGLSLRARHRPIAVGIETQLLLCGSPCGLLEPDTAPSPWGLKR